MKKPIIYTDGTPYGILACCPKCESNLDWSFETTMLGGTVYKWRHRKRKKCIHCGQLIDWSDYKGDLINRISVK